MSPRRSFHLKGDPMTSGSISSPVAETDQSIQLRRLLVVGEDLGGLTASRPLLESLGYQIAACCYEQAVRSLQSEAFDFVLLNQGSRSQLVALDWGRRVPTKPGVGSA
jgi:hypothetical protein